MNTKPAPVVQAGVQDVVPKYRSVLCTEADIERAVAEAFAAVFRRQNTTCPEGV